MKAPSASRTFTTAAVTNGSMSLAPEDWGTSGANQLGPGVTVGDGVEIRAFSHLEQTRIEPGAVIGPYARLRPGSDIDAAAHVGNFVEIKNSTLAAGAKANHLAYLGDATIGSNANIGAGTITCNYDGVNKHPTVIGDGVFIGSDTQLVAPVTVVPIPA